ncbi:MAG: hypothetical protein QNJ54_35820 [Prochloraceae cyanobacterium]|nr:hypothetical protein [Prochloraceae cyanobacterium]
MKRDRNNGFPECATYVRVPKIETAYKMQRRIHEITNEDALVVVSQEDPGFNSSFVQKQDPSQLIEEFAAQRGYSATSWIVGVGMLGEGVSIKRLKYRIHATNICACLSFEQDLGRLLRKFPEDKPQPVETLIPAHPYLRDLALDVMNEVSEYFIRESEEQSENNNSENNNSIESETENGNNITSSLFQPISSTGEFDSHIVDGEEIYEYTKIAEWAMVNHPLGQNWGNTAGYLAQFFEQNQAIFEVIRSEYESELAKNQTDTTTFSAKNVPLGFSSEYSSWLADKKTEYASNQAHRKAKRLAYLLISENNREKRDMGKQIAQIHTIAKQENGIPIKSFTSHEDWEKIYIWLSDKVAQAEQGEITSTEDL